METLAILAKVDDVVVGLILGGAIGFLAGPVLRSAIVARERAVARREARLTEQLIERLEAMDADDVIGDAPADPSGHSAGDRSEVPIRWRTSH